MAVNAGKAFVELVVKGKEQVNAQLGSVQKRMKAFGGAMKKLGGMLAKAVAAAGAATLGGLAVVLTKGVKAASDMQETMNKFNVVFGENSEVMKKWSDATAGAFGRSKQQIADTAASFQDLLVPMGLTGEAATGLSQDLTKLGIDVASFNNKNDADVVRDFQAALTGSGEVMKKYGVVLNEAATKAELLKNGIDPKTASNAQKAMARYNIILEGTSAAQGDVSRSGGSWANQIKAIKGKINDFLVVVGEKLLPVLEGWASDLSVLLGLMSDSSSEMGGAESAVDGLVGAMELLGSPIQFAVKTFFALASVLRKVQSWLTRIAAGISLITGDQMLIDELNKLADEQNKAAGENFELAFSNKIDEAFANGKKQIEENRQAAGDELEKVKDFTDPLKEGAGVAVEKMDKAADKMVQAASPETLDAARDVAAYTKFTENKSNKELRALKKIEDAIKDQEPALGLV